MVNPARKEYSVELGGAKHALRFERYDFAMAQTRLGVDFFPYGVTEAWSAFFRFVGMASDLRKAQQSDNTQEAARLEFAMEADAGISLAIMHFLAAGLMRSWPGVTLDTLADLVTEVNFAAVATPVFEAVCDFKNCSHSDD